MTKYFILGFFCIASLSFGAEPFAPDAFAADTIVVREGEGQMLLTVFKAIQAILYGESSGLEANFHALVKFALVIGAFGSVCIAFFRQKFTPLIYSFFLPGILIVGFILVPRTALTIQGEKQTETVYVPLFLGKFAYASNQAFRGLENLFKEALDTGYSWTGKIGKSSPFNLGMDAQVEPALEQNMREFCRECVFRDIGLGLYKKKELAEAEDILAFLNGKTAKNRSVFFEEAVSCQKALEKMVTEFQPSGTLNPLFPQGKDEKGSAPLKQRILIDLLKQEIASGMEKPKKEGVGLFAQGAAALVAFRAFLEALLYLIFPLVILLSLLSFGIKILIHWAKLTVWVAIWPLFYIGVNLFLNSLWTVPEHLSLTSFDEMKEQYKYMEMVAFLTIASVPLLSWLFLKGGTAQIAHLASSLFSRSSEFSSVAKVGPGIESGTEMGQKAVLVHDSSRQTFDGFIQNGRTIADLENTLVSSRSMSPQQRRFFFMKLSDSAEVIFCDNHVLVAHKPAGLLTQPDDTGHPSLEAFVKSWVKEEYHKPGDVFLHCIHRLDRPVSGLVLFARTSKALSRLNELSRLQEIQRYYLAEIEGILAEKQGKLDHHLIHAQHRALLAQSGDKQAKRALLTFEVLQYVHNTTLVKIVLETGRYHQIRAQFSAIGHPILHDIKYGSSVGDGKNIHLHCAFLAFQHPVTREILRFESPAPFGTVKQ